MFMIAISEGSHDPTVPRGGYCGKVLKLNDESSGLIEAEATSKGGNMSVLSSI
jgi:hypothetical protein